MIRMFQVQSQLPPFRCDIDKDTIGDSNYTNIDVHYEDGVEHLFMFVGNNTFRGVIKEKNMHP
jgi:hypothetical protein